MYTYTYLVCVFVLVCLCICMCTRVSMGGGGVHTHVDGCARCRRVSVGWGGGARTCVCAIQHVCMCSLNTGCTPDSINFVIIVILCALKLKFAIHVLMLD